MAGKRRSGPGAEAPGLFYDWPPPGPECGLDEAGRGPLAGPVCAAAVVLPPDFPLGILDDSKKLSAACRESAALEIRARARWGLGWASHDEIDRLNILQASLLAMRRAYAAMLGDGLPAPGYAIVDGNKLPGLPLPERALVKADATYASVMAASILAKTARDAEMERLALLYPGYGYEVHKGYPTAAHRRAIRSLGPSPIQRLSFRVS